MDGPVAGREADHGCSAMTDNNCGDRIIVPPNTHPCYNDTCGVEFNPYTPLIKCSYLSDEFLKCDPPKDLQGNTTAREELGYGCTKWGGQKFEDVMKTSVMCEVLEGIECHGDRRFLSAKEVPCIKYNGHYFVTTLIYSVLLGFLGMDRFCLGHTGTAVGKLLTLGGVGIWWIVDIILLALGELQPADDSNWVPYY
ncbi:TM2 domain-containing protein 2 [Lamellibrachia satsuma]|nr:TM2 domain-containing protein 2 [Lamellibrachia satsuma]